MPSRKRENSRPTVHTGPASHYTTSPYETIVEFSWSCDGQLYGGLFSLHGIPDQKKLVVEVYRTDPGVEVRNETALRAKLAQEHADALTAAAAHNTQPVPSYIGELARVRASGLVNMMDAAGVYRVAHKLEYNALAFWLSSIMLPGVRIRFNGEEYVKALEAVARIKIDEHDNLIWVD